MKYKPSLSQTATLPSGSVMNLYFDHPNHNGFGPHEHLEAHNWHHNMAKKFATEGNIEGHDFHKAQADLHALAANGSPTVHRPVPTDEMIRQRHPNHQDMWRREAEKIKEHNKIVSAAEPFRMNNMVSSEYRPPDLKKMRSLFKRKMQKSHHTVDLQEIKRVEQDRDPPPPALIPKDTQHPDDVVDSDLLKQIIAKRQAQRNGVANPGEQNTSDPRQQLPEDQRDAISAAIAARRGQRHG